MASPANVALYSHRHQLLLTNTTSGSSAVIDRVQLADPSINIRADGYYELGRKGRIGTTLHPPEYRFMFDQNMVNNEAAYILAGKNPAPAGAQTYQIADFLGQSVTGYILTRNNDDTILNELEVSACVVAEANYRFTVGGACMQSFTLVGRTGKLYTAANVVHSSWGTLDDASPGGIHGKDARIWLTSGSVATSRAYRLQNFNIRAVFPNVFVRELGNRNLAGTMSDVPDITVDFDLLQADDQPTEKLFTLQSTYYDYANPIAPFNAVVKVFDPVNTEGGSVLLDFKIENVQPTGHTPVRSQVRNLATSRYSLVASKESTAQSGGLLISNRNVWS